MARPDSQSISFVSHPQRHRNVGIALMFLAALGYVVLGDWPDFWTFVGAAVVIASGLYLLYRKRVIRQKPADTARPGSSR